MDQLKEVVDIPSVEAQLKVLKDGLLEAKALIVSMPVIGRVTGSTGDQAALTEKLRIANEQLAATQQKLISNEEKLKTASAARAASQERSAAAILVAEEKVKKAILETELAQERLNKAKASGNSQLEAQQRREKKIAEDVLNDYKQLGLAYNEAATRAANYAINLGKLHPITLQAQEDARKLKELQTELQFATKNFTGNVGNYPGGMGGGGGKGGDGGDEEEQASGGGSNGVKNFRSLWRTVRYAAYILPGLGIAGIFNGIFTAIAQTVEAMGLFDTAGEKVIKIQLAINKTQQDFLAIEKELRALYLTPLGRLQFLENELKYSEAIGKSKRTQLELEYKLASQKAQTSNVDFFKEGGFDKISELGGRMEEAKFNLEQAAIRVRDAVGSTMQENRFHDSKSINPFATTLAEDEKTLELRKVQFNIIKEQFDRVKSLNEANANNLAAMTQKDLELEAYKAEQIRKYTLDTSNYEEEIIRDKNTRILSNERSTLAQRVEALRSNFASERKSAEAQLDYTLSRPDAKNADGSYTTESKEAMLNAGKDKLKANKNYLDAQEKIEEEYRRKKVTAEKETEIDLYESQKEFNDMRIALIGTDFKKHLSLIESNVGLERQVENLRYQEQLSNASEVAEQARRGDETAKKQLERMENDHYRTLVGITSKGELEIRRVKEVAAQYLIDEQEKAFQGRIRVQEHSSADNELIRLREYNDTFETYIQELKDGTITLEKFEKKKKDLDESFKKEDILGQIEGLRKLRTVLWSGGQNVVLIDKQIEELRKKLAEQGLKSVEDIEKKKFQIKKDYQRLEYELAQAGANLIKTIIDRSYQDRINNIQDEIDLNKQEADSRIQALDTVVMAEQEKQASISNIKDQAQVRENELLREQKRIRYEQAKFEQLSSLASIAIKTIETVAKIKLEAASLFAIPVVGPGLSALALTQVPIAIGIGVLEAGAIIAKGLPKFKDGGIAPGGNIIANEEGSELFVRPNGEMYWGSGNGPTIMAPEKGTEIISHNKVDAYLMNKMSGNLKDAPEAIDNRVPLAIEKSSKSIVKAIKDNRPVIKNELKIDLSRAALENYLRN